MNGRLLRFAEICEELNLTISRDKCTAMLFGRYLLENRHPIFKIRGTTLSVTNSIVYLGLTLDSKMNWIDPIEITREKVRDLASSIKKSIRKDRGLQAQYRKIWYKTVTEKRITYGAEIWFQDMNVHALRKLSSCQRLGLLTITSTYRTVSTDALSVITGVVPLHITLKHQIKRFRTLLGEDSIVFEEEIITKIK